MFDFSNWDKLENIIKPNEEYYICFNVKTNDIRIVISSFDMNSVFIASNNIYGGNYINPRHQTFKCYLYSGPFYKGCFIKVKEIIDNNEITGPTQEQIENYLNNIIIENIIT